MCRSRFGYLPERLGEALDLSGFVVVHKTDTDHAARLSQAEGPNQFVGIVIAVPCRDSPFPQLRGDLPGRYAGQREGDRGSARTLARPAAMPVDTTWELGSLDTETPGAERWNLHTDVTPTVWRRTDVAVVRRRIDPELTQFVRDLQGPGGCCRSRIGRK
jgi:hypothetical protein